MNFWQTPFESESYGDNTSLSFELWLSNKLDSRDAVSEIELDSDFHDLLIFEIKNQKLLTSNLTVEIDLI
jgi:hypothetical protein